MSALDFFQDLERQLGQLEKDIARDVIVVEAEAFHDENFRKGGFTDQSFTPWVPRKKADPTRALLVKTGNLRGHASKGEVRSKQVVFTMPEDYMTVHNEGSTKTSGRGSGIPKRQYMGESAELERRIKAKATDLLNKKFKK